MSSIDAEQRANLPTRSADRNAPELPSPDPTATAPVEFDLRKFLG